MSSHCFLEGANIHHHAFVEGAIILPCQLLWGQMSTHAIFHRGADVRGGKCPAPLSVHIKHTMIINITNPSLL